jgi:integral membrane protein
MIKQVRTLRLIGIAEGVSFLVLLLIAMPMKYYFNLPIAVKIVGWAHGALFIAYVAIVFASIKLMKWKLFDLGLALAASLIPLGTFFLDKSWKKREQELASSDTK